jgi:hypothetical protein
LELNPDVQGDWYPKNNVRSYPKLTPSPCGRQERTLTIMSSRSLWI